jgi:phosphate uptake regulator
MRRLVSEQVTDAVHALAPQVPRAGRLALREGAVNALGARIERECFSILARQPRTSRQERRLLGTIIRIATTLERIGDAGTLMLERSAELSSTGNPVARPYRAAHEILPVAIARAAHAVV